jgi:hypothetical protein
MQLSGGSFSVERSKLTISLIQDDASVLKLSDTFGKNVSNSYISFDYKTLSDLAGNWLSSVSINNARKIDLIVNDTVRPLLLSFTFDLSAANAAIMTLYFNEPVSDCLLCYV